MAGELKFCIVFLIILLSGRANVKAQLPYLKHFTTRDGLPSSTLYGGIQDIDGFIWFGTDVGVTRFDGKHFTNFSLSDGLSDNEILVVDQDSKGRIWFLGFNGTVSYYFNGKIYNSENDSLLRGIRSDVSFLNFFEDNCGRIWFSTSNETILLYPDNRIQVLGWREFPGSAYVYDSDSTQIVLSYTKQSITKYFNGSIETYNANYSIYHGSYMLRLKDGSVLFQSKDGIVRQNDTIQTLIIPRTKYLKTEYSVKRQIGSERINYMILTPDNKLWLSLNGNGFYVFDYQDLRAEPFVIKNTSPGALLCDHEGNIWMGTLDNGIFMLPAWVSDSRLYNAEDGITEKKVYSVSKNLRGDILLGQNNGKIRVISKDGKTGIRKYFSNSNYNRISFIRHFSNEIWLGSDEGVFHIGNTCRHQLLHPEYEGNYSPLGSIKDLTVTEKGLFICGPDNLLFYALPCTGNRKHKCQKLNTGPHRNFSIHAAFDGTIWYSNVHGLFSLKGEHIVSHGANNALLKNRISDMLELSDSTIVLAMYGYGLVFYRKGKVVLHLNRKDGLASNICRRLFVLNDRIYVASPEGVSIIHYAKGKVQQIKNYNTTNALPTNDVNDVYADEEEILIATASGLVILKQKNLTEKDKGVPLMRILSISMENREIDSDSNYQFDYTQNSIQFKFIGIYYKSPDEVIYRYRINEKDAWQFTQNTSIDLLSLQDGAYTFQIQAKVKDGLWSSVESFSFRINPPIWKTNWFIAGIILLIMAITITLIQMRFRKLKEKHREKIKLDKQINGLEQQALQAMMNPHFIFNVMNSIQLFMNSNDRNAANYYLSEFARLIRMNLNLTVKGLVSLEEEIDYMELYLSLEKIRFGEQFSYEIILSPDIDDDETMLPPMMIQPFLENAIWHGILPLKGKGHVILSIQKAENKLLKILVIDNGVGISDDKKVSEVKADSHKSYGMALTRQRLELIEKETGTKLHIKIEKAYPEELNPGTRVELLLPDLAF